MIFVIVQMAVMSPVRQDIAHRKLTLDHISGTGACPDTYFYCQNQGHIGASILSSRVRDGLCGMGSSFLSLKGRVYQVVVEPRCCDGSDELPGVCENVCRAAGEKHRKKHEAEMKLRKTVSCVAMQTLDLLPQCTFDVRELKSVLLILPLLIERRNVWRNMLEVLRRRFRSKRKKSRD